MILLASILGSCRPPLSFVDGFTKQSEVRLFIHYMPWFDGPEGFHWDYNQIADTSEQVASHYYPLVGAYDGLDSAVLRYHALLIRAAGFDGVLLDWYGTHNVHDYAMIHARTEAFIDVLSEVGLEYGFVYEDRTTGFTGGTTAAEEDFAYLDHDHFAQSNHLELGGTDVVLNFGPIEMEASVWESVLSNGGNPLLFQLEGQGVPAAAGEFAWVNEAQSVEAAQYWYDQLTENDAFVIGAAMPRFHDYYEELGLDTAHPDVLTEGLLAAMLELGARHADLIQVITWNDFSEGTQIEPTVEDGFRFLQVVQDFAGTNMGEAELELVLDYYRMHDSEGKSTAVEAAWELLRQGQFTEASQLVL